MTTPSMSMDAELAAWKPFDEAADADTNWTGEDAPAFESSVLPGPRALKPQSLLPCCHSCLLAKDAVSPFNGADSKRVSTNLEMDNFSSSNDFYGHVGDMSTFKVIIIGAGPVGLVLAHALQASSIDYVIVEQRAQVPPEPAYGLFLWPHILRIFHQLGLLDAVEAIGQPMLHSMHLSAEGEVLRSGQGFEELEMLYGYPMMLFNRGSFAKTLVEALDNWEQHVKTNKRLCNIVPYGDGIKVEFADGSSEKGSMVIGADGIWSTVRDQMMAKAPEGLFDQSSNPFEAPYAGVFGRTNYIKGLVAGSNINVYQQDTHVQVFTSETEAHMIAYRRIPVSRERTHFGQNNAEDATNPWLQVPVAENVTFGDLWESKSAGGSANFDEGVLRWWHWGRMVLVGDAAHKMNPVRGAGACCGIEDAITLVNVLKRVLRSDSNPSETDLRQAFMAYQGARESSARLWMDISRVSIDLSTGPSQPALKATRIADMRTVPLVANGPILDDLFLSGGEKRIYSMAEEAPKSKSHGSSQVAALMTMVITRYLDS
ncbi:hypothetical protein CEP52_016250 [Fusarium oligoseptatum]|uniref:FAD-binding domain-containing protein n=1 Tax=Fusarium oligoseptatum TaxID=2604345 RepID=A0A428S5J3_9HYPO|nr:hypothetical protein CEP52_016250 [Fusarium oligoseptatum]